MPNLPTGVETIFVSKDNKQEYIEVDDFVRQGEYKYTYSDNSNIALKSEQADLVVNSVEKFAQVLPLNLEEIFIWYFEQKGVDNPERFLGVNNEGINENIVPNQSADMFQQITNQNTENQLSQNLPQDLPQQNAPQAQGNFDMNTLALLLGLLQKVNNEKGDKAKPDDFIKIIEQIIEQEKNNEV